MGILDNMDLRGFLKNQGIQNINEKKKKLNHYFLVQLLQK